jgi:hypothetical protein
MPVPSRHVELALYADDTAVSHVSQGSAAFQLSGILPRRIRALAQEIEGRHERVEEHGDALHTQAYPEPSGSCSLQ